MSIPIGQVTLTVNVPGVFHDAPPQGIQGVIITNDSPFNVAINLQGTTAGGTLLPFTVDFFPVRRGFNGNITYSPTQVITNPSSYTATQLTFDAVGLNESFNPGAYPIALPRAAVTTTASGKPIFTATFTATGAISGGQHLEVFNPIGSGVNCILHSARAFTTDTDTPTANLIYTHTDHNFTTAVSIVCHSGFTNPPVSVCHATGQDLAGTFFVAAQTVETLNMPGSTLQDMPVFPDNTTFGPGEGLIFELSGNAHTKTIRLTLKWTEDIYIPPAGGVNMGTIVNQVINEGNTLQAVLQATKKGDSPEDALIMNDGSGNLNGAFTFGADVTMNGAGTGLAVTNNETVGGTLGVTGAATLSGGLASTGGAQTITGNAAGSLHLGQSATGDTLDTTATDTFLKSGNAIHFQIPSGTDQAIVNGSGLNFKTIGNIAAGFQVIGDTSIAQAGTSVAHSLGVVPQLVIPILDAGAAGSADVIKINYGTMTSSHFTAYTTNAGGTGNVRFFVLG